MKLLATGNRLTLTSPDRLVSGSINIYTCEFAFDDSWAGYMPTAVFECGGKAVEMAVIDNVCQVPFELLTPNARIRVGIYGISGDKRRPTTYAEWMPVERGTETGGAAQTPPDPNVYESILAAITDGRLVGPPGPEGPPGPAGPDGYSPTVALTETESGVRVSVQNKDNVQSATVLNGKDGAPGQDGVGIQSVTQTTTSTEDGGTNIVTVTKTDGTTSTFEVRNGGGGTSDHSKLKNRDAADQHPMSAITGLEQALEGKQPTGNYLTDKDLDATLTVKGKVADAAAVGARLDSLSEEIITTSESKVAAHNTGTDTHSDIRLLIQGLSERLSAVADSDDTTLDQLSEVVAYIKSNRDLISAITTSKVNVSDIVDNLTTNVANKPLSAAQGVALKALIDALTEAMPEAYTLPIASPTVLGGVKPVAKTDAMTQSVGVDEAGALWAKAASGGGGLRLLATYTLTPSDKKLKVEMASFGCTKFFITYDLPVKTANTTSFYVKNAGGIGQTYISANANAFFGYSVFEIVDDCIYGYAACWNGYQNPTMFGINGKTRNTLEDKTSLFFELYPFVDGSEELTIKIWGVN